MSHHTTVVETFACTAVIILVFMCCVCATTQYIESLENKLDSRMEAIEAQLDKVHVNTKDISVSNHGYYEKVLEAIDELNK